MAILSNGNPIPSRNIDYFNFDREFFGDLSPNQREYQPFILDLVTREKLFFQTIPREIIQKGESNFVAIATAGRNNPSYHYTGSEDSLDFVLTFYSNHYSRVDVVKKCKWLEALTKNDGYDNKPHEVVLAMGNLYKNSRWIVTQANPAYSLFNRQYAMLPGQATVEMTLKRITESNRLRSEILRYDT